MADSSAENGPQQAGALDRRHFFSASTLAMTGGLAAGYGAFFAMAGRYLYPSGADPKAWLYVAAVDAMEPGDSFEYVSPAGAKVVIARQDAGGTDADFIALSNTCPHLGCKVEWQPQNDRFFCPCHNGAFDSKGVAIQGPPAAAGQSLPRYPLRIEDGLLFIEVPIEPVVDPWRRRLDMAESSQTPQPDQLANCGVRGHRQLEQA